MKEFEELDGVNNEEDDGTVQDPMLIIEDLVHMREFQSECPTKKGSRLEN